MWRAWELLGRGGELYLPIRGVRDGEVPGGPEGSSAAVVMLMTLRPLRATSPASLGRKTVRCLAHRSLHNDGNYKKTGWVREFMVGRPPSALAAREGRQSARGRERVQAIRRGDCRPGRVARCTGSIVFHHRPQRRGQDVAPEHDLGFLKPTAAASPRRSRHHPEEAERQRGPRLARTFQNIALFSGLTVLDNLSFSAPRAHEGRRAGECHLLGHGPRRRHRAHVR